MRFELTKLFAFCTMAFLLCSCSSYQKYQTSADQNKPFDCTGLHMEHASWYFVDEYNQSVTATGRCSSGMKHGFFEFYIDGYEVARTKFTRNQEVETLCFANSANGRRTVNLKTCMIDYLEESKGVKVSPKQAKNQYEYQGQSQWDQSPWN